ncbi:MAG: Bax inhibitor-1/YccA family protein [Candidatus Izemoplasmatales bacterium]|nr:Bax inhibitor-1/YccA family protein [Candidatus Izemoplasmatales bacterium]
MRFFRSSNPVMRVTSRAVASDQPVTYTNVAVRTVVLVGISLTVAIYMISNPQLWSIPVLIGSLIVAFIAALVGMFNVRASMIASIVYAAAEGVLLGVISSVFAAEYQGIVQTALMTTMIVLAVMMLLHSTNIIKVNQRFTSFVVVAMISVILMSLFGLIFGLSAPMYMLISVVSALLACLYLMIDFEAIRQAVEGQIDQQYGWMLALGLMVTLVWLYFEILRLLAIFANSRR